MCKHIVQIRRTNSEVKPHLVVVAELLHEGGLDGLGGRTVAAARVAHEHQHLLRGLGPRRGLLLGHRVHIPATPSSASSPAVQTQPKGRETERRDLVNVQPHEMRELAPHPVEPPGGGVYLARNGHGDGDRRAGATARARGRREAW
jgi:hypothetical protein